MSKRSEDHRYCSACETDHRVKNGPCDSCFLLRCPLCGVWQPVTDPFICSTVVLGKPCEFAIKLSEAELRAYSHDENYWVCTRMRDGKKCGRKLRAGPRDKRRSIGLKS